MTATATETRAMTAEEEIRAIAAEHEIVARRTALDDWADDVTRLAGDDVRFDDVQELVVAIGKAKVMNGPDLTRLHARYLEERKA